MFENLRRGRQAGNLTTNVPKILVPKSSSEKIFSRTLPLGAPEISVKAIKKSGRRVSKCALCRIRPRVWKLKIKSTSSGAQTS